MIQYHVRSRFLVDIVNDINNSKIEMSPYFQRKLVWRVGHKVDFIKTILLGYPFPEIFLSRGKIDVDSMTSKSSIVDGQQRMNSIKEFIEGRFRVDGKTFKELTSREKEDFLKYEIAIIDLDLADDDEKILDIFKRLNRTFYALSNIEKMATEFASSEFMLVAKLLCKELPDDTPDDNVERDAHEFDPNISSEFIRWANKVDVDAFRNLILNKPIFSKYEISRNVHLMFTLNVMATREVGIYNRNDAVLDLLNTNAETYSSRDQAVVILNGAAKAFLDLNLADGNFWYSKSTAFSLLTLLAEHSVDFGSMDMTAIKSRLDSFALNVPEDYALAAREGVNGKKERLLRRMRLELAFTG